MRYIRDKYGDRINCIRDDGRITDKFDSEVVAHLKSDRITDKFDSATLFRIRPDGTITDKYDSEVVAHIRQDGTITDKYDSDRLGSIDLPNGSHVSSGSSNTDFLEAIIAFFWLILGVIWKIICFVAVYVWIPEFCGMTWAILVEILFLLIGLWPVIFITAPVISILSLAFIPYWILGIACKVKKTINKRTMLKFFFKYWLKGPFAYPQLLNFTEEHNVMPRLTGFLNTIVNKFQKRKITK